VLVAAIGHAFAPNRERGVYLTRDGADIEYQTSRTPTIAELEAELVRRKEAAAK